MLASEDFLPRKVLTFEQFAAMMRDRIDYAFFRAIVYSKSYEYGIAWISDLYSLNESYRSRFDIHDYQRGKERLLSYMLCLLDKSDRWEEYVRLCDQVMTISDIDVTRMAFRSRRKIIEKKLTRNYQSDRHLKEDDYDINVRKERFLWMFEREIEKLRLVKKSEQEAKDRLRRRREEHKRRWDTDPQYRVETILFWEEAVEAIKRMIEEAAQSLREDNARAARKAAFETAARTYDALDPNKPKRLTGKTKKEPWYANLSSEEIIRESKRRKRKRQYLKRKKREAEKNSGVVKIKRGKKS